MVAWLLNWIESPLKSPDTAYHAAYPRFIIDTVDIDGVPFVRMTDPVLGIHIAVDAPNRAQLHGLFRRKWIAHCGRG